MTPPHGPQLLAAHLGVLRLAQQLLLGLVQLLCGVIAVHWQQVVAEPVKPETEREPGPW